MGEADPPLARVDARVQSIFPGNRECSVRFVSRTVLRQRLIQENVRSTAHLRCSVTKLVCPARLATLPASAHEAIGVDAASRPAGRHVPVRVRESVCTLPYTNHVSDRAGCN
jgi:hypothetical protein